MKKSLFDIAYERLHQYINEHGLRHSPVRTQILQQACLLPQPFTAQQLEEVCQPLRVATGTIYNSLKLFVVAQILHATSRHRGQPQVEYEVITGNPIRMEIICKRCGRITEFPDKAIARMIRERHYSNFDMQHFSLLVYGECKLCRKQTNRKTNKI